MKEPHTASSKCPWPSYKPGAFLTHGLACKLEAKARSRGILNSR